MSQSEFRTIQEHRATTVNGFPMLLLGLGVIGFCIWRFVHAIVHQQVGELFLAIGVVIVAILILVGLFTVQPNEARVLIFFGRYIGSCRIEGFRWLNVSEV